MPKLIPFPVVVDLLDDGPVLQLVLEYRKGKSGTDGCESCVGRGCLERCDNLRAAARARYEKDCINISGAYYVLRPLKKSEVR